jgi:acetoin utilization protein AcuB
MRVRDIMTKDLVSVGPADPLIEVRALFYRRRIRHVLVVEEGFLKGVISDRDVLSAMSPFLDTHLEEQRDVSTLGTRADAIMTPSPIAVGPDDHVDVAMKRMLDHRISCLPVVSAEGKPVGIVTTADMLRVSLDDALRRDALEFSGF